MGIGKILYRRQRFSAVMQAPLLLASAVWCLSSITVVESLSISSSSKSNPLLLSSSSVLSSPHRSFLGAPVGHAESSIDDRSSSCTTRSFLTMRKQKASDRRTRRMQAGEVDTTSFKGVVDNAVISTLTNSPMNGNVWNQKDVDQYQKSTAAASSSNNNRNQFPTPNQRIGGRGRSRKRSALYNALSFYHNKFLTLLTAEYKMEEEEVLGRIKASLDDPLGLEASGYALFDLYPERRGNLYSDEVYRLVKANDATTVYPRKTVSSSGDEGEEDKSSSSVPYLPSNNKFTSSDVIMLTLQPHGSGDFFSVASLPTSATAVSIEARVLNTGPTYVDVAIPRGTFEIAFGPAPNDNNNTSGAKRNRKMRLRADRFFSDIPYKRMVNALSQLTTIPEKPTNTQTKANNNNNNKNGNAKTGKVPNPKTQKNKMSMKKANNNNNNNSYDNICVDELIRDTILWTHAINDPASPLCESDVFDIERISSNLAKPPMASSAKQAKEVIGYIKCNPQIFRAFNGPQLVSIEGALTRRMTMIQGPPGSGKTTVAAGIGFGFVHQSRSLSSNTKVLATAFSNVGADNLAEAMLRLGLRVVRVGKASAVTESLWDYTLDAFIDRDPDAKKALADADKATRNLAKAQQASRQSAKGNSAGSANNKSMERYAREAATAAVKASIQASNVAATRALRQADVIVSTSTGASDPRLLAACGLGYDPSDDIEGRLEKKSPVSQNNKKGGGIPSTTKPGIIDERTNAPDGLPPLSFPFVIVDEACQSVEPATLIPILSTNSCRSLVMLGDPCQLPPTIKSQEAASLLSVSLMERLASTLPHPTITIHTDKILKDGSYLNVSPLRQAKSLLNKELKQQQQQKSYRKRFAGSLLLSVQYRMHPSISSFSSAIFYDGLLSTPSFLAGQREFPPQLRNSMPCGDPNFGVRMVHVGGRCNERQGNPTQYTRTVYGGSAAAGSSTLEQQTTFWNEPEAERVISMLKQIFMLDGSYVRQSNGLTNTNKSVGIVTPYNGQVQLIKSMIVEDEDLYKLLKSNRIEINSVDGYQGRERDIILFSAVRSNRRNTVGFLSDWRRMNVAMTRAREALIVIGDLDTLTKGDPHWAAFGKWCEGMRCIIDDTDEGEEDPHELLEEPSV